MCFECVCWFTVIPLFCFNVYCFSFDGDSVLISGYSSLTPASHVNFGQQYGNGADLFVRSVSNLQRLFSIGNGPQSSTNS